MIKKIKSSLGIKIFSGTLAILIVISLLTYGSIRVLMPHTFVQIQNENLGTNLKKLLKQLETAPINKMEALITQFAVNNQTNTEVYDSNNNLIVSTVLKTSEDSYGIALSNKTVFQNSGETYSLITNSAASTVDQLSGVFSRVLPYVILIIFLLSVLTSVLFSRMIAKPIVNISNISQKMTQLDMSWRCKVTRSDEIGTLAANLNLMAAELGHTLSELQSANEKLMDDIARERRQEKQRLDFFRAVSHELKTPITVFKGELEGMIYSVGQYKDRDTYLRHSLKTVIEMEHIVKEIISVSRMSSGDFSLSMSDIPIDKLVSDCCHKLQGIAEDKNLTFYTDLEPCIYRGDQKMLKKAFLNIIGNAVSHSPFDAAVTVSLKDRVLFVENTGAHIDNTDMEQLFLPFYRTDQSRSSNTGGSGLGLYIVKTVFDRHHLDYKIENSKKGVRFTVSFDR